MPARPVAIPVAILAAHALLGLGGCRMPNGSAARTSGHASHGRWPARCSLRVSEIGLAAILVTAGLGRPARLAAGLQRLAVV